MALVRLLRPSLSRRPAVLSAVLILHNMRSCSTCPTVLSAWPSYYVAGFNPVDPEISPCGHLRPPAATCANDVTAARPRCIGSHDLLSICIGTAAKCSTISAFRRLTPPFPLAFPLFDYYSASSPSRAPRQAGRQAGSGAYRRRREKREDTGILDDHHLNRKVDDQRRSKHSSRVQLIQTNRWGSSRVDVDASKQAF